MGATWWQYLKSLHTDASDNDSDEEDFADRVTLDDDLDLDAAQESGNELSDEYDLEPIPENDAIAEITDFEHHEFNHDSVFTTAYKHISCFIHTLQLVVKIFESTPSFRSSLQTAYSVVKKVNKSCKATELLIQKAGKKLVNDCPTRWDSTYLMIQRLLDVKPHLNEVLEELTWDSLTTTQWKHLDTIQDLLQPFAHHTNITSAEHSTTIAMVVPVLKELNLHLQETSKTIGVGAVSKKMLLDLNKRFEYVTNPKADNFDSLYVASTLLNPPYRRLLDSKQVHEAKQLLLKLMVSMNSQETIHTEHESNVNESTPNREINEPPLKRFKHLDRVSKLLEEEAEDENSDSVPQVSKEE